MSTDPSIPPAAQPHCRPVPVSTLPRGSVATVHAESMSGTECDLLRAMGLTCRCRLRVCKAGGNCIVRVARTRLGLSGGVADRIMVLPVIDQA